MITYQVNQKTHTIPLGRQGENNAHQILFNTSCFNGDDGGEFILLHQRNGDEQPYPVTTTEENGYIVWTVTSADTANAGIGRCELQYQVDDTVIKSQIWKTRTEEALEESGEVPDPESGWVAQMLADMKALLEETTAAADPPIYNLEDMGISNVDLTGDAQSVSYDVTDLIEDLQSGPVTFGINLDSNGTTIPMTMTGYAAYGNFLGTDVYEMAQVFYYNRNYMVSVVVYETGTVQVYTTQL